METERVPKSFGCFPRRGIKCLSVHRLLSKSSSNPSSPRSPKCPITPKTSTRTEDELIRQVFRRFDGDNDGKISALEFKAYFGSVGEYLSHEEAQRAIDDVDADGDGFVDLGDFLKLMRRREGEDEDFKRAFEVFEMEKGCGRITPKSLQRVLLSRLGDERSQEECEAMIGVFDSDGNGELDFQEFHRMMASH